MSENPPPLHDTILQALAAGRSQLTSVAMHRADALSVKDPRKALTDETLIATNIVYGHGQRLGVHTLLANSADLNELQRNFIAAKIALNHTNHPVARQMVQGFLTGFARSLNEHGVKLKDYAPA